MTTYDNTNRGVLFDNNRKKTPTHPDMQGSLNINGVDHWFDGWWKTGAKGDFLSLSIGKPKETAPQSNQAEAAPVRRGNRPSNAAPAVKPASSGIGFADMDQDIPF